MLCCAVRSNFAIIMLGKREVVTLFKWSYIAFMKWSFYCFHEHDEAVRVLCLVLCSVCLCGFLVILLFFLQTSCWERESWLVCFNYNLNLMWGCLCYVSLHHGAMGCLPFLIVLFLRFIRLLFLNTLSVPSLDCWSFSTDIN